jgi:hypothetical protein
VAVYLSVAEKSTNSDTQDVSLKVAHWGYALSVEEIDTDLPDQANSYPDQE